MKKLSIMLLLSTLILGGCLAAGSSFKPKTVEGAQCKATCASDMAKCRASSYTCDRAAATCMSSCSELDLLVDKK